MCPLPPRGHEHLRVSGTGLSFLSWAQPSGLTRWQAGQGATKIQTLGEVQTKSDPQKTETQRTHFPLGPGEGELEPLPSPGRHPARCRRCPAGQRIQSGPSPERFPAGVESPGAVVEPFCQCLVGICKAPGCCLLKYGGFLNI